MRAISATTRSILITKRFISPVSKYSEKHLKDFAADDVYDAFVSENGYWLEDYALYMAIKDALGGISWSEWPAELKDREEAALNQKREELAEEIAFYKFQQFMFLKQWKALKAYAYYLH